MIRRLRIAAALLVALAAVAGGVAPHEAGAMAGHGHAATAAAKVPAHAGAPDTAHADAGHADRGGDKGDCAGDHGDAACCVPAAGHCIGATVVATVEISRVRVARVPAMPVPHAGTTGRTPAVESPPPRA
jgi:hypothetical protein